MEIKCDKCNKPTSKTKQITSKKTGKQYTVFECVSGCTNGKWAYSFFPPKEAKPQPRRIDAAYLDEKIELIISKLETIDNKLTIMNDPLEKKMSEVQVE